MKQVPTKVPTDTYSANEFSAGTSQEAQNAVLDSGQTLNEADQNQLSKAMSINAAGSYFYIDSGAINALVLNPVGNKKAPPAYFNGQKISGFVGNTTSGATTVNVDGVGVVALNYKGVALDSGFLRADDYFDAIFNSSSGAFDIIKVGESAGSTSAINVKDFGAIGDGIADDTVAIQAALDSMTAGGTLVFPQGIYKITSPISRIFPDGVVFRMSGYGAKIDGSTITGGSPGDTDMITLRGSTGASSLLNVSPTEGDFSVSLAGTIGAVDNNIVLLSSTDLWNPTRPQYVAGEMAEIKDVTSPTLYALTSPLFDGYVAANTTAHLLAMPTIIVEGIEFEMDANQIALNIVYSKNPVVKNCKVHGARHTGISFDYIYGGYVYNNDVYDNWYSGTGTSYCLAILTTQNTVISDNNLREARHCITTGGQEPSRNVLHQGNTCTMHPDEPNLFSIDVHGNCEFVKIFDNFCEGIVVAGINTEIRGNLISGNLPSISYTINIFQEIDSDYYIIEDNVIETIGTEAIGFWHSPVEPNLTVKRMSIKDNDITAVKHALSFQPRSASDTGCEITRLEISRNSLITTTNQAFLINANAAAELSIPTIKSSYNTYDAENHDCFVMITAADRVDSSFDTFLSNRSATNNIDIQSDDASIVNATIKGNTGAAGNGRAVKFTGSGTGRAKLTNSSIEGLASRAELVTLSDYIERDNDTAIGAILNTAGARLINKFITPTVIEAFGSGSPEGAVTAPVSSNYHRDDGGAATSFYVKESGVGNTGWVGK